MRLSKAFFHVRQIAICVVALFFLSTARGAHADSKTGFTDIHAAAAELKRVFNFNVEQYTRPPETLTRTVDAVDLLDQHRLISNGLMHHVKNMGALDFDIILSAQDWNKSWRILFGEPQKTKHGYSLKVTLARPNESTAELWTFTQEHGFWVVSDILYQEPGEKPFTLSSLKEGD